MKLNKQEQAFLNIIDNDPIALSKKLFNSTLWDKQEEIVRSVWENERTAVRSCNSGGKSRVAAEIALLYLLSFRPSRVITTAPTFLQVEEILWKEIASLYRSSAFPIGGQLNRTSLELGTIKNKPWDASGVSTNEVNRFQGFKSAHLLVILDEALGVAPEIWEAMEGLVPHRILVIGNPLDGVGDFYNCFSSPLYNKICISALECIAWQNEHGEIPGLVSQKWVDERAAEWGHGSPLYQSRVLGEFPEEGADTLIARKWVEEARHRELPDDSPEEGPRVVGADVATKSGISETVIGYRYGHTIYSMESWQNIPIDVTADKLQWAYSDHKPHVLFVDGDGVGQGVSDILTRKKLPVSEFHGGYGQQAIDSNKYKNLRSQFYWIMARKFEDGLYSLKHLSDKSYEILKNELCSIKILPHDALGRIRIETKDDMRKRGIKSPDFADCLMMSEFGWYMSKFAQTTGYSYR